MFRFRLRHLFIFLAVICVTAYAISITWLRPDDKQSLVRIQSNLKTIISSLAEYQQSYGVLPYSRSGESAALFSLQPLIDASAFETETHKDKKSRAHWDAKTQQLVDSDVIYFNAQNTRMEDSRVILACVFHQALVFATGDGFVHVTKQPIPASKILGNWVTAEDFLVTDSGVFEKWCELHPRDGLRESVSVGERQGPYSAKFSNGSTSQYTYRNGRLKECKIVTANGRQERLEIETDQYGRITGISRSAEN